MRTIIKWLGRILIALLLAAVVIGLWKREEIMRLMAVNSLFYEDRIISNFSNMNAAFLTVPVARGDTPVAPLAKGPQLTLPADVVAWNADRIMTSMVVLKDGAVVHESYEQGTGLDDRRISWSIAKSYLSALMGIVLNDGAIGSLDDRVTDYVPSLKGGAYDGVTIRQVMTMTSGVLFDEDYLDYDSDIQRMGRVLALGGKMDDFAASLSDRFAEPGTDWQYTSIDTHVLGMVIRAATGRSITDLMSERIIVPLGLEQEPYYLTDGTGVAFVLGGLNITTRDYARFAQMIAQGGQWQGQQIVPSDWILASTTPQAPTLAGELKYGFQWWMPEDARPREYFGFGIYGQFLYIDETAGVVIITTAADRKFREPGRTVEHIAMLRRIVDAL